MRIDGATGGAWTPATAASAKAHRTDFAATLAAATAAGGAGPSRDVTAMTPREMYDFAESLFDAGKIDLT